MNDRDQLETAAQIRGALGARGLAPNKRFGQNFLIEPRLLDVILRLAEIEPGDLVLEVGTGPGNLTQRLAATAGMVVTVEIDSGLFALALERVGQMPNVRLVHGDVLETKSSLNAEVVERIEIARADPAITAFKVVANLPYNVSTPFLSSLFARYGPPDLMVLLVQKELAENLVASPGSRSYGPLTIVTRLLCEVRMERTVPREVFWPRPKVESAIVVARPVRQDSEKVRRAWPLVRHVFSERRKMISTVLRKLPPVLGGPLDEKVVAAITAAAGLTGRERAESLDPERFLALDRAISARAGRA